MSALPHRVTVSPSKSGDRTVGVELALGLMKAEPDRSMRILFLCLNYSPEQISVAVYSSGLCEELVARGHEVRAIVGKPYYPEWRVYDAYRGGGARVSIENGVWIKRVPLYVPANPTGLRRIIHHLSFALSSLVPMLREARSMKPDVVLTEAPSLIAAPVAHLAASISGAKSWLHIQDFEVEAAFATGLVDSGGIVAGAARRFERLVMRLFDQVSGSTYGMCRKAETMIARKDEVFEFRNWARIDEVKPLERPSAYRERWAITTPHVALYAGNIANKQGIEILVDVASLLRDRPDLTFVICGQGPNRANLESLAVDLPNIRFYDLQPIEELNELLGMATIHLLPHKAEAADLMLPSKLTNMLASGRPVVTTAHPNTGLARELEEGGVIVPPGDAAAMAAAIVKLIDQPDLHRELSRQARSRAEAVWDKCTIIDGMTAKLSELAHS